MNDFDTERRREKRLRRFGAALGLLLALIFHILIFWGPRISYSPVLERARIRRVIKARPYRPPERIAPQAKKITDKVTPAKRSMRVLEKRQKPVTETPPVVKSIKSTEAKRKVVDSGAAKAQKIQTGETLAPKEFESDLGKDTDSSGVQSAKPPSEWETMLAELEVEKKQLENIEEKKWDKGEAEAKKKRKKGSRKNGPDQWMDPRIRMNVVSYPPTIIEKNFAPVGFPVLKVKKKRLTEGICRVYYRVWTNQNGKIVRSQLKYPSTKGELSLYAPFVDEVVETVSGWRFPETEADVHVDVLFDLEEAQ